MSALVVAVADPHINSTYGLALEQVELDNGAYYVASQSQQAILKAWRELWDIVADKKAELDATCYVVVVGDAIDMNKHDDHDPITQNTSIAIEHATALLWPARKIADHLFMVRGTEAHTGGHAELEEQVAKELGAEKCTLTGRSSWWFLPLETEGVTWDVAHHTDTFSRRPWTVDAAAERQSAILRARYLERGELPKDMALRGHNHKWTYSNGRLPPWTFMMGPFCLSNAFAYRKGHNGIAEPVMGAWWVVEDGDVRDWDREFWEPLRVPMWRAE